MDDALQCKVAIVLLNWNGWQDTIACIESLCHLHEDAIGVFVCDNASSDGSVTRILGWSRDNPDARLSTVRHYHADANRGPGLDWPPAGGSLDTVSLIETGGNLGFAGGSNVGLRFALADGYDRFWLLNNDTEVSPDTLTHMMARMDEDRSIGMCGSTLVYASQPTLVQNLGGGDFNALKGRGSAIGGGSQASSPIDRAAVEARLHFISGASMLVSRAFLEEIGLMAEEYFLYYEETDWAERGKGRFKLGYAPASIVRHKVGASIGTNDFGGSSPLSVHYMTANRLRFCWRYSKLSLPFVIADTGRAVLRAGLARNWLRAGVVLRAAFNRPYRPATKRKGV